MTDAQKRTLERMRELKCKGQHMEIDGHLIVEYIPTDRPGNCLLEINRRGKDKVVR